MLALIIIVSSIILTFALKIILTKANVTIKVKFPVLMVIMVISVFGVILILLQTNRIKDVSEIRKWSTTQGLIVSSFVQYLRWNANVTNLSSFCNICQDQHIRHSQC